MARNFGNFEGSESPEEVDKNNEVPEEESEFENDFDNKWDDNEEVKESKETNDADKDGVIKKKCIREDLEGQKHPETGVPYERKVVDVEGQKVEGVFPQFKSEYETQLPEDMYKADDPTQMKYCTKQLREEIKNNPELAEKFDERQLQQIEKGVQKIDGYTWHHTEEPGKMQLVDEDEHADTSHTGGRSIWGGGKECR